MFQFDFSFLVLFVMSCLSLVFSLSFYLKARVLRKLSKNISVNVFDKTFNVFDPYPERRKSIHSLVVWPLFLMYGFFLIGFVVLKIFETGLVLGLTIFIFCFGLMMIDDAYEIYVNAKIFIKAVRNRADFGIGDLNALFLLRRTMPKLSWYYVLLAGVFLTSVIALPYIVPGALLALALFVGTAVESTSFLGAWSPYLALFAFTILFMTVYFALGRLKSKIFGFPRSVPLTSMEEQFERVRIMAHWAEAPPYELSHRPVLEDSEVEERKRRLLRSEK